MTRVLNNQDGSRCGSIPDAYRPAEWRNVTGVDANGCVGIGFDLPDEVIRLRLDFKHLLILANELNKCVHDHARRCHSLIPPGTP